MKFMHKTTKVSTNLNTDILFQDMINLIIQPSRASQTKRVIFGRTYTRDTFHFCTLLLYCK